MELTLKMIAVVQVEMMLPEIASRRLFKHLERIETYLIRRFNRGVF